ncbi:hypothetical protein D3C72_1421200 [compost metagenome]
MSGEVAGADEVRGDCLLQLVAVAVDGGAGPAEGLHQGAWQDQVGEAQGTKQHLAEGPHIEDAPLAIQPLQGGERPLIVLVLPVVVVLQDPGAAPLGLRQQCHAARQAHGHAQGVLVGRGAVDEPGAGVFAGRIEPLLVHRHRVDAGAGALHGGAGTGITRILHPDGVTGIDEQLGRQQYALLGAGEDQDLLRLAHHAPRLHQVAADGGAQRGQPLRIPVIHPVAGPLTPLLLHQATPECLGKEAGIRLAGGKGVAHLGHLVAGPPLRHLLTTA